MWGRMCDPICPGCNPVCIPMCPGCNPVCPGRPHASHAAGASPAVAPELFVLQLIPARLQCSMVKVPPWQRPSSAPAAPWGAPGGSGQLGTPKARPGHWDASHGRRCSSWVLPTSAILPHRLVFCPSRRLSRRGSDASQGHSETTSFRRGRYSCLPCPLCACAGLGPYRGTCREER